MTLQKTPRSLSYDDIRAAGLLGSDFKLPPAVTRLSTDKCSHLLADPLIPFSRSHTLYEAQRGLLWSIGEHPGDHHLRTYCRGLFYLSERAWEFVAQAGKTTNVMRATVDAGHLNDMEAPSITTLSVHWHELRRHAGAALQSA